MKRSKRQTLWSKLIALGLVVVLTMAMGINVFAVQSTDTTDFTVSGFDTDQEVTVTAYQIITVNVNDATGEPAYPMYTWNSNVATWLGNNGYGSYIDNTLDTNAVADVFENMSANDKTTFLEELAAAIKKGTVSVTAAGEVTSANGSAAFENMLMGEYLLVAKGGLKLYQPTTVTIAPVYSTEEGTWGVGTPDIGGNGVNANMKSQDLPFEKEATSGTTVQIGDTVTYKLTAVVPDYPEDAVAKTFKIGDTLSEGLTFQSLTITVSLNADMSSPINPVGNYRTIIDGAATEDFVIEFTEDFINANAGETVYVRYSAIVNEKAFTTDSLGNSAYSAYNDPYDNSSYVEVPAEEHVYTYGITLTKKDKNDTEVTGLEGAEFVLKQDDTELKFSESESDGVYIYDANGTATLTTASDGTLQIKGINVGTYVLEEITAPDGYVLPTGSITITINDDADGAADGEIDTDSTVTKTGTIAIGDNIVRKDNVISFDVLNVNGDDASFTLPVTGGAGTVMFTIIGILLMGGAAAIIIISKKRSHTR